MNRFRLMTAGVAMATMMMAGAVRVCAQATPAPVDDSSVISPTLITLHVKNATPEDVFRKISEQCGTPLAPSTPTMWRTINQSTRVTLDMDNVPFWTAMQQVSAVTGVRLSDSGTGSMRLVRSTAMQGLDLVSGACVFTLQSATYTRNVQLGADAPPSSSFSLSMSAMLEPKVHMFGTNYGLHVDEAVDDKGNSLLAPNTASRVPGGFMSGSVGTLRNTVSLVYPKDPGTKFARLKGALDTTVHVKSESIEIPDILNARNVTKSVTTKFAGEVALTVIEVTGTAGSRQYSVRCAVQLDPSQDQSTLASWAQSAELVDSAGGTFRLLGRGGGNNVNGRFETTLNFLSSSSTAAGAAPPAKLVWIVPTEIKKVTIPFEFTDLLMP